MTSAQLVQALQLRFGAALGITALLYPVPADADLTVPLVLNAAKAATQIVALFNSGLADIVKMSLLPKFESVLGEHTSALAVLDSLNSLFADIGAFGGTLDIIAGINPLVDPASNAQFLLARKLAAPDPDNSYV